MNRRSLPSSPSGRRTLVALISAALALILSSCGTECRVSSECDDGYHCDIGSHTCIKGCSSNADCFGQSRCDLELGRCEPVREELPASRDSGLTDTGTTASPDGG